VRATLTGRRRAQAQSLYAAAAGSAIVIGQLVGGLLVTANIAGSGWRPIFLINIPIGLLALATVGRVVPENRSAHPVNDLRPGYCDSRTCLQDCSRHH
jgi:MFS family permease